MLKWFDRIGNVKRRGGFLPGRLRNASRRGVTLVELMISMLILAIVCLSWLQILGIQSARKEARRREAVERLAGMMDAFMYSFKTNAAGSVDVSTYRMTKEEIDEGDFRFFFVTTPNSDTVHRMFVDSPIGYSLEVMDKKQVPNYNKFKKGWPTDAYGKNWLVGRLYNHSDCSVDEAGEPFFTLPVCLGM